MAEQANELPAWEQLTLPNEPLEFVEKLILLPDHAGTLWPVPSFEVALQEVAVFTDKVTGEHRTVVRL